MTLDDSLAAEERQKCGDAYDEYDEGDYDESDYDEDDYDSDHSPDDDLDERDLRHFLNFNDRDQGGGEDVPHRVTSGNVDVVVQATGVSDAIHKALELVEQPGAGEGKVCIGLVIMVKPQNGNAVFCRSVNVLHRTGRLSQ